MGTTGLDLRKATCINGSKRRASRKSRSPWSPAKKIPPIFKPFWLRERSDANLGVMSEAYHQLLDATIDYLQGLKQQGMRYVNLSPSDSSDMAAVLRAPVKTAGEQQSQPRSHERSRISDVTHSKAEAIAALRTQVMACVKCAHLVKARKNVVFGIGSIDAELMFVGEAPGADEDAQGEPF